MGTLVALPAFIAITTAIIFIISNGTSWCAVAIATIAIVLAALDSSLTVVTGVTLLAFTLAIVLSNCASCIAIAGAINLTGDLGFAVVAVETVVAHALTVVLRNCTDFVTVSGTCSITWRFLVAKEAFPTFVAFAATRVIEGGANSLAILTTGWAWCCATAITGPTTVTFACTVSFRNGACCHTITVAIIFARDWFITRITIPALVASAATVMLCHTSNGGTMVATDIRAWGGMLALVANPSLIAIAPAIIAIVSYGTSWSAIAIATIAVVLAALNHILTLGSSVSLLAFACAIASSDGARCHSITRAFTEARKFDFAVITSISMVTDALAVLGRNGAHRMSVARAFLQTRFLVLASISFPTTMAFATAGSLGE